MMKCISTLLLFIFTIRGIFAQMVLPLPAVLEPQFQKDTVNISNYGAIEDGLFLNTNSIGKAIEAIFKKGGGVVLVPAGLWLTGPLVLKSNVNLHLQSGATLLFTSDFSQYPLVETNWEGLPQMRNQSPISAAAATNIAITGRGIIDGNGDVWRMVKKDKLTESAWKKLNSSGGMLSDDKKTWYPTQSSRKGSEVNIFVDLDTPGCKTNT